MFYRKEEESENIGTRRKKKSFWTKIILSGPLIYIIFLLIVVLVKNECTSDLLSRGFWAVYWSIANMVYMIYRFVIKQIYKYLSKDAAQVLDKKKVESFKERYKILWVANFLALIFYFIFFVVCGSKIIRL